MSKQRALETEILYWQRMAGKRSKPGRSRDEARAMARALAAELPRKRGGR